jgi:hypothetical protein
MLVLGCELAAAHLAHFDRRSFANEPAQSGE